MCVYLNTCSYELQHHFFFREKHESNHQPQLHCGVVLKYNANQRYATTAISASVIREVASKCKVPLQVRSTAHHWVIMASERLYFCELSSIPL